MACAACCLVQSNDEIVGTRSRSRLVIAPTTFFQPVCLLQHLCTEQRLRRIYLSCCHVKRWLWVVKHAAGAYHSGLEAYLRLLPSHEFLHLPPQVEILDAQHADSEQPYNQT